MTEDKDNTVINFAETLNKLTKKEVQQTEGQEPFTNDDLIEMGIEAVEGHVANCTAFISIIFDKEGAPNIIHAGDIDLINAIGALEYAKNELLNSNNQYNEYNVEELED